MAPPRPGAGRPLLLNSRKCLYKARNSRAPPSIWTPQWPWIQTVAAAKEGKCTGNRDSATKTARLKRCERCGLAELDAHLQQELHSSAASVARWVKARFGVNYTDSGMTALLHRLGYRYKKPKLLPGKAPAPEVQEDFVASYKKLKENKGEHDAILFMDATHPQHNPVLSGGWIKRGRCFPLKSNTGRRRLNINGVVDVETMHAVIRYDDTIDAASTIALFEQIEATYPKAATITIFCDNARYYRSKAVRAYLEHSRINLQFLPPYAPNLNLIERFWKFFKRQVLYNRYYETFADYKAACKQFFADLDSYAEQLRSLLTENFEIIRQH